MSALDVEEFFDFQRCSSAVLPDPRPLVENLARSVIEVLLGVREAQQLARWLNESTFDLLVRRSIAAKRARALRKHPPVPTFALGGVRLCEPADGVVEGAVVIHSSGRSRAVALRLEGLDGRWRATSVGVL